MQPFLRWAGSKRKQVSVLREYWNPDSKRYVEPFMGSACLFFDICPKSALISDINTDLVRTYLAIKEDPSAVYSEIVKIPHGEASYYNIRKKKLNLMSDACAAASFIFLNRFCFNGLYRTNKSGEFNVPYAHSGTGQLPSLEKLIEVSVALTKVEIKNNDFMKTLSQVRKDDFVYIDPPYAVSNRRVFNQYSASSFGVNDLINLSSQLDAIDAKGARFVLSYAVSPEVDDHFNKWTHRRLYIQRNIAGFAKHRRRAGEVLITNCL